MTPFLTDAPEPAERDAVFAGLRAYNDAQLGEGVFERRPLAILLRDAAGRTLGGLIGLTAANWLYVETLQLPPESRGQGLGRRILEMAEAEARARGCIGIRLDTYSFQARGFYEKAGFSVFGTLEDCPPGHARFSMMKRLDEATGRH